MGDSYEMGSSYEERLLAYNLYSIMRRMPKTGLCMKCFSHLKREGALWDDQFSAVAMAFVNPRNMRIA